MQPAGYAFFIDNLIGKGTLLLLSLVLYACDGSNMRSTIEVDDSVRLSEKQLLQQQTKQAPVTGIFFGFDLRASPQEDTAQYLPFLRYLQQQTGDRFLLHYTPKGSTIMDELGNNMVQIAAMGALGYLKAKQKYQVVVLARGLNRDMKAVYRAVFVTRPNSRIHKVRDFKGHSLAFGNHSSTQGALIPRIMLKKHNIALSDLKAWTYAGSHQQCAEEVISGRYEICGMQDTLAMKLEKEGLIKIIAYSDYYPASAIVANTFLPKEKRERIKQALLNFDPNGKLKATLYHWERTEMPGGFVAASDSDYLELERWARFFGFLPAQVDEKNSK